MERKQKTTKEMEMKNKTNYCNGQLELLSKKAGLSMMSELWGGPHVVAYSSYVCEHGHEYETTGTDKRCTWKIANQQRKS